MSSSLRNSHWAALPVLLAGAFIVVLDFFIVNVALPSIALDLGASESSLEWVVAGYGLSFAAFLITAGRLGDQLGRRRLYAIGLAAFTVASALCGLAPSPTTLVIARVVQGVAGAIVMPQVLSIIGVTYRGPDYVRAMSLYGVALGLAAVGGQVIGGALVESDVLGLGWRGCFLINIPIGLAALALTPRLVPESSAPPAGKAHRPGAGGARADAAARPRVQRARGGQARRRGCDGPGARARRGVAAAHRGPPARLAAVDVGVVRRRPGAARRVRRAPGSPDRTRRERI